MNLSQSLRRISRYEMMLIEEIVTRAILLAESFHVTLDEVKYEEVLVITHVNYGLRLHDLISTAKDSDFAHDVWGILKHLDVQTGQLKDGFLPRYILTDPPKEDG